MGKLKVGIFEGTYNEKTDQIENARKVGFFEKISMLLVRPEVVVQKVVGHDADEIKGKVGVGIFDEDGNEIS